MNRLRQLACWQFLAVWALLVAFAAGAHAQAAGESAPAGSATATGTSTGAAIQPISDADAAKAALLAQALSDTSRMVAMKPFQSREEIERFFDVRLTLRRTERDLSRVYESGPISGRWFKSIRAWADPVMPSGEVITMTIVDLVEAKTSCIFIDQFTSAWGIPALKDSNPQVLKSLTGTGWYYQNYSAFDVISYSLEYKFKDSYRFTFGIDFKSKCISRLSYIYHADAK